MFPFVVYCIFVIAVEAVYSIYLHFVIQFVVSCLILKHRGTLCGPVADGYESRTIPNDLKEDHDNRRNQQVYSASPVKTVDKTNDSGM